MQRPSILWAQHYLSIDQAEPAGSRSAADLGRVLAVILHRKSQLQRELDAPAHAHRARHVLRRQRLPAAGLGENRGNEPTKPCRKAVD